MTSKENEISLIMEGDTLSALKLWIMREKRCQKTCNRMAEPCAEVIEDHLWSVACHATMVLRGNDSFISKGWFSLATESESES